MLDQVAAFLCAEALLLIVRGRDLQAIIKKDKQRTLTERKRIGRGLLRSIFVEALVLVPASVMVVLYISPLILPKTFLEQQPSSAVYAIIGVASYGFPFAAIKQAIFRIAMITVKEFASTTHQDSPSEDQDSPSEDQETSSENRE